jgi:hypothetical protein
LSTTYGDIPTQNVMKDEFGWEIPVEMVPIPSEGKVYPEASALFNRKTLNIKAMTAREEDILSSTALLKDGTVITHLIESCLIDKSVDVRDMLLGDRNALMVSIRITGYGSRYSASATCPSCDAKGNHDFNLSELEIKPLDIDPVRPGENLFAYTLPVTKKEVHFRLMTGRDEHERNVITERRKKSMPGMKINDGITSKLSRLIFSVDGITDKNKVSQFVRSMPALDSKSLRKYINENEPGIDMTTWITCENCGESSQISLPMGTNFFWPSL